MSLVENSSSHVVNDANNISSLAAHHEDMMMMPSNMSLVSSDDEIVDVLMETTSSAAPTIAPTEYVDRWSENLWMLVTPRVTACISLLGIICVALEAYKDLQADKRRSVVRSSRIRSSTTTRRNVSIISRIQLFYQIPLFSYTLALALGTLPVPRGQAWGSVGNTATCSFQGILLQFGLHAVYGWDMVLSTTYLMMVRYKVANLRLRSFEKYYHVVIWSFATIVSVIPLSQEMYNFNNTICWLESYPDNCEGDECTRGEGAILWQNIASLLSMIHLVYSVTIMISLYCSIRRLEDTKHRILATQPGSSAAGGTGSIGGSRTVQTGSVAASCATSQRRKHSRAVGIQGILYASGMIMTMFPTALYILLWNAFGLWSTGFSIFATSLVPLVGYVNFCIFMRGRSVESCHTRYAKLLRRAHSWMFDYELHFECHCLPKQRGRGMGTGRTSMPGVITRVYQQSSVPNQPVTILDEQAPVGSVMAHNDPEKGDIEEKEEEAAVDTVKNGPFSGFTVKVKGKGNRFSQYISELGASAISEEEDEDCTSTFGADTQSPKEAIVDKRPPSKPMRILSELLGDGSGSNHQNNQHKAKAPPVRPQRRESCTLETSFEINNITTAAQQLDRPPAKAERYETEIETPDNHHQRRSFANRRGAPPALPKRYETEVENDIDAVGEAADTVVPLKKSLFSGFFIRVKRKGSKCNQPVSELGASGISEVDEEDYSSEEEETPAVCPPRETAMDKQPPSMPLRIVSEVLGDDSGHNDYRAPPVKPGCRESCALDNNQSVDATAPVQPERGVEGDSFDNRATQGIPSMRQRSELRVEASHRKQGRSSFVRRAPPTMPQRFESELEISDPSNHEDHNTFGMGETKPDQARQQYSNEIEPAKAQTKGSFSLHDYSFSGAPSPIPETTTNTAPARIVNGAVHYKQGRSSFVRRAPPTMPQRFESELEISDPSNQEDTFAGTEPDQAWHRCSSGEIEPAKDLTESSFSLHDYSFSGAPPTIHETTTDTAPARITNGAASSAAPTMPQRFVSEVEYSESGDSSSRLESSFSNAPATQKQQSSFSKAVASARGALAARVKPQQYISEPGVPNASSSHKKKNNKKKRESSKTSAFKVWGSDSTDFETWRSEAEEVATATAAPSATESKHKHKNKNSSTDFKVWKSEISEFETW